MVLTVGFSAFVTGVGVLVVCVTGAGAGAGDAGVVVDATWVVTFAGFGVEALLAAGVLVPEADETRAAADAEEDFVFWLASCGSKEP